MEESTISKVFQNVDDLKEEMTLLLSELIQIQSVTPKLCWEPEVSNGQESQVNRRMKETLESMGVECELYAKEENRENLCARYKGTGGGHSLMFTGHVDVVQPGDEAAWTEAEPFSGKIDDRFVYGRGTVDMKGGNTAAVFALKALQNAGVKLKGDLVFNHVVGEEVKDNEVGTSACLEYGYTADAAILCEPSCEDGHPFEINLCSGGVAAMRVIIKGKGCHIGVRREVIREGGLGSVIGVDAIEKGMIIYNALHNLEKKWGETKNHEMFPPGQFCINCGMLQGGVASSTVAPKMTIDCAITFPPQDTFEDIKEEIETCILDACKNDSWLKENPPEIVWLFHWPSYDTSAEEPIAGVLQKAIKRVVPEGGEFMALKVVCDAPFIIEHGIPTVLMGPGNIKYAHAEDEKVEIERLLEVVKIYALTMMEWCEVDNGVL